jgi:hypothetical protein
MQDLADVAVERNEYKRLYEKREQQLLEVLALFGIALRGTHYSEGQLMQLINDAKEQMASKLIMKGDSGQYIPREVEPTYLIHRIMESVSALDDEPLAFAYQAIISSSVRVRVVSSNGFVVSAICEDEYNCDLIGPKTRAELLEDLDDYLRMTARQSEWMFIAGSFNRYGARTDEFALCLLLDGIEKITLLTRKTGT